MTTKARLALQTQIKAKIVGAYVRGEFDKVEVLRKTWADLLAWKPPEPEKPKGMPQDWSVLDNLRSDQK